MMRIRRRRAWIIGLIALALIGTLTGMYLARIAPPWPATEGTPYEIQLGSDGCPIEPDHDFVDSPGELVPPNPTEVVLCTIPNEALRQDVDPPRQRVLREGAADFAAWLNRMPDRNQAWRRWQRLHSGWWPDAPPESTCLMIGYPYDFTFVLRYSDRVPVALTESCRSRGWTTGARTRSEESRPSAEDEFVSRFDNQ